MKLRLLIILSIVIIPLGLGTANGQEGDGTFAPAPDRYPSLVWRASPYLDGCTGPTDGAGSQWYELDFDDSGPGCV